MKKNMLNRLLSLFLVVALFMGLASPASARGTEE